MPKHLMVCECTIGKCCWSNGLEPGLRGQECLYKLSQSLHQYGKIAWKLQGHGPRNGGIAVLRGNGQFLQKLTRERLVGDEPPKQAA